MMQLARFAWLQAGARPSTRQLTSHLDVENASTGIARGRTWTFHTVISASLRVRGQVRPPSRENASPANCKTLPRITHSSIREEKSFPDSSQAAWILLSSFLCVFFSFCPFNCRETFVRFPHLGRTGVSPFSSYLFVLLFPLLQCEYFIVVTEGWMAQ